MSHMGEAHRLLDEFLRRFLDRWDFPVQTVECSTPRSATKPSSKSLRAPFGHTRPNSEGRLPGYERAFADASDLHFPASERDPGFETAVRAFALYASNSGDCTWMNPGASVYSACRSTVPSGG